ncbi:hypothetical protein SGLAM104S_06036 [Streptomyces glaucescens]
MDDTNIDGDHRADLWLRNAATDTGYSRYSRGTSFLAGENWGSWAGVNLVLQTDLDRDGYQDLVYRRSSDGDVFWAHYVYSSNSWVTQRIADNWKTRTRIVTPGDVTGDYLPDLLSVNSAGALWIYPGKGNGTFAARVQFGSGWNQYNQLRGHGDFTGDGRTDLIARNASNGYVYLYKGLGKTSGGAFASRIKLATWSSTTYNAITAVGDVSGDGRADLLARTRAARSTSTGAPGRPRARSSPQGSPSGRTSSSTTSSAETAGEPGHAWPATATHRAHPSSGWAQCVMQPCAEFPV